MGESYDSRPDAVVEENEDGVSTLVLTSKSQAREEGQVYEMVCVVVAYPVDEMGPEGEAVPGVEMPMMSHRFVHDRILAAHDTEWDVE